MELNELLLKTAFCCMACDGSIAKEEVSQLKKIAKKDSLFDGLNIQEKLNEYVDDINQNGPLFLSNYINDVKKYELDNDKALQLIKIAIDVIESDNQIEYSEISFFKKIRKQLSISDEEILQTLPDKEDYLLPDIERNIDDIFDFTIKFDNIVINDTN